jgi:hypothetical protein
VITLPTLITRPMGLQKCRSVSGGSLQKSKSCSPSRTSRLRVSNQRRSAAVLAPPSTHQAPRRPSNSAFFRPARPGMQTRELRSNLVSHQQRTGAQSDRNLLPPQAPPARNLPRGQGRREQSMSTLVCNAICLMKRPHNGLSLSAFEGPSCHFNSVSCRGVLGTTCWPESANSAFAPRQSRNKVRWMSTQATHQMFSERHQYKAPKMHRILTPKGLPPPYRRTTMLI